MRVIIAGSGDVGTYLARFLSVEEHEVVLLDADEDKVEAIQASCDVMTVLGFPTSFKHQKKAGVDSADLFIAVTPSQETNITASFIAKRMGAKTTVARVDFHEFTKEENIKHFREMGIDHFIYPEGLGVKEILAAIHKTGIRQSIEFSNGELVFSSIKIKRMADIVGKKLSELDSHDYTIVAITRGNDTIIPDGETSIELDDTLYFVSNKACIEGIKQHCGKTTHDIKKVMILGGSRFGKKTAAALEKSLSVKLIDIDEKKCLKLANRLEDTMVIHADGRDLDILKQERIDKMDAFVAVTNNSEMNLLSCVMAKKLGVKKVIAEIENNDYLSVAESLGIGTYINKKLIAASYLYGFTMKSKVHNIKMLHASDAEVLEFIAQENSKIIKKPLSKIKFPKTAKIGGIIRDGKGFIAKGDTVIEPNDRVVVFAMPTIIKKLEKFFS
jgi:trk system potassium uptake protein TrkA